MHADARGFFPFYLRGSASICGKKKYLHTPPQHKKDLKTVAKQGRDIQKLRQVLEKLAVPESLPTKFKDHKRKGQWRDFREYHIEPDWLLIYTITDFELWPTRIGTYAELFE